MAERKNVSVYSTENREVLPIYPLHVFRISEKGETEINASATALSAQALQLLVLVDGQANIGDLEQKLAPALKATPVIMTTAEATRESVMRGLVGGADGYLTKPLNGENLLKAVRTVLGPA